MYDYLKTIWGGGDSLTFDQFAERLSGAEGVELVNLADGGYVPAEKYDADTAELAGRLEAQERDFAERAIMSGYRFTSKAAEKGVLAEIRAKNFRIEDGKLAGGEEFIRSLMENDDYKAAFCADNNAAPEPKPVFAAAASGTEVDPKAGFDFGFTHIY